ncbi:thioredoxin domain-containing protein 16 [Lampris incognitus]|uniref:thioredoxin domain-containing protein 16 n=1 Tax=Lampris incognitus TaxID=2546036 RepID=UPI0024B60396|nr:thioredoxin domain-containing protein 16 [Lampris incognitus]
MVWLCIAMCWLWTSQGRCTVTPNTSGLIEYTADGFLEKLNSGKTLFVYFGYHVSPTISLFLAQLEKSAVALHDYGISVAKVNCSQEWVVKFCTGEKIMKKAFLFRSTELLKSFDVDIVFDINAIVSHTLFAILFDELRYVWSDADLQALERTARGKTDMVLGYVQMLGTQEHRALMETVFVHGAKYQFILTNGGPILEHLGVSPSLHSSGVWFLHCRVHSSFMNLMTSDRCPVTPMRKSLSTLSLYSFLQLMEAPLVSEVYEDPFSVQPPQPPHLQTPQLFLFSRPSTEQLDLEMATTLAWRLRGLALLVLVHRESPAVQTPEEYNVAYRLAGQGSAVKYLTLTNLEEVMELFTDQDGEDEWGQEEEDEEEEEEEENWATLDFLDDEIGESVYRNRGSSRDMDSVTQLTADNFHTAVAQNRLTVVLFYLKWDAVSMAFLSSFIDVAERILESEVPDVQMAVVDCGEWTDLCAASPHSSQPITAFPSVLLLRPQEPSQRYSGMLGSEALHRFIMLSDLPCPVLLSSQEEMTSFLQGRPGPDMGVSSPDMGVSGPGRVLGLFQTETHESVAVFIRAARSLRGEIMTGLLTDRLAEKWAMDHSVELPIVLVFQSSMSNTRPSTLLLPSSSEELLTHLHTALLHTLPELTVENLPSYLSLEKPLLLLFVGEEEDERVRRENEAAIQEMRGVLESREREVESYLACWIHPGRTPAGISVLESYLGSLPPLPALVLSHLPSGGELYHYSPNTPIETRFILQWLQDIEEGQQPPAGKILDNHWTPLVPFYDFLSVMDQEIPEYAQQRTSKSKEKKYEKEEDEKQRSGEGGKEEDDAQVQREAGAEPSTPLPHSEL